MKRIAVLLYLVLLSGGLHIKAQSFYDVNNLQKIEITFSQSNWDYILDTAKAGKDNYVLAQLVKINGIPYDSAGVKYRGGISYGINNSKNPFHIELDFKKNQDYQGYKDIKLGTGFKDPSFVREVLGYKILNQYMASPRSNFCQVYVNGTYIGVFSNTESISKVFVNDRFYSKDNSFFQMDNPGCNLKYYGPDSASYTNYEIKSNSGWKNLISLCDTLNNKPNSIAKVLDVDRILWMLAFDNVLVNLDSYIGGTTRNYYMYMDDNKRFNPVIWDLNQSFGNSDNVGAGPPLTISQMQSMSPDIHISDPNWPLIKQLLANPEFKRSYIAHMRTIVNENFANGSYTTTAINLQSVVDTAFQSDVNKFYSYTDFQSNINNNVVSGLSTVPGISVIMDPRSSYLLSTPDFTVSPPSISSVSVTSAPVMNTVMTVTANVTNANSTAVYLGYRYSKTQKFSRILMYDDGLHNDGLAADNIFATAFTLTATSAQYYIYAENNNAAMFSPERAEYEFYNLIAIPTATVGQVKINEFLADNQNDVKNEYFNHEDWIELYNTTSSPLELHGLFLTDDYSDLQKLSFPQNSIIQPYGYFIIWADGDPSTTSYLHANFKLSPNGEQLMLSAPGRIVLDSVKYGIQNMDKSMARCPDGSGAFTVLTYPTFKLQNCAIGINELVDNSTGFHVFPNPANNYFVVKSSGTEEINIGVYNAIGQEIYKYKFKNEIVINTASWQPGVYLVRSENKTKKIIISH
jgi:hypothetical protein